jgi:two-component system sensor histidine kinase BaeS
MVLILLATSLLLVGAMAVAMNWSFQKGFLDYLTEAELSRLDGTVEMLANAYRREGSWTFLPHNAAGEANAPVDPSAFAVQASRLSDAGPAPMQQGMPFVPPPPPNDRSGLSTRLRLLDAQRHHVIGPPDASGKAILRPVELENEVIGWLSLTPQPLPGAGLERSFRDEQLHALYPIATGAGLLGAGARRRPKLAGVSLR